LKAPGFNPRAYKVRNWFQSLLCFQMQLVPLQLGDGERARRVAGFPGGWQEKSDGGAVHVELCWTHSLKATGFKPLPLNINPGFQNVPFKFNPRLYATAAAVA
jgi:hypothetical protein